MIGPSVHLSSEQLHLLLDNLAPDSEQRMLREHLEDCPRCRAAHRALGELDRGLRRLPIIVADAEFTRTVMQKVQPSGHLSFTYRIVENLAYVFAALMVVGIIAAVFIATGVIDSGQISEGQGVVSTYSSAAGDWLSRMTHEGTAWLERFLPVRAGVNIMLFGFAVLGGLALLDHFVQRRFAQRTR